MRRLPVILVAGCAAALWSGGSLAVSATAQAATIAAGKWSPAIEVPGIAALNQGHGANVASVSCTPLGYCLAGGFYQDSSGNEQAFVASQRYGTWGTAIELPGTAALNQGGLASITSVSCASAGNCVAAGTYDDGSRHEQAFVASQQDGTWQPAIEVPGTGALNQGVAASVTSVSCAAPGNCAAGGFYTGRLGHRQAFVTSERDGTWQPAIEVPGSGALNQGGTASVNSVSCAAPGDCTAGGSYTDRHRHVHAFVAGERHGTWRAAIVIRGTGAVYEGGTFGVTSLSCASAGSCVAVGNYDHKSALNQVFVATERHGTWDRAIEIPGTGALDKGGGFAFVTSVSCASAGNCVAGGDYSIKAGYRAFVATERHGTWHRAIEVARRLNHGYQSFAGVTSVSCASAGNCLAGGSYQDSAGGQQVFVVSEQNGTWQPAIEVPGTGALNKHGGDNLDTVSCSSAGNCAVGGIYSESVDRDQAYVASEACSSGVCTPSNRPGARADIRAQR